MSDGALFKKRLGQYGLAWVAGFLIVLVGSLGAGLIFHINQIRAADVLLPAAFAVLGLALVLFLVRTLMAPVGLATKLGLLLLGALLALPLLWAPVLAVLVSARATHAAIEYSSAYAGFRIFVGRLIYPPMALLFGRSMVDAAWQGFQMIATIVGFIAAMSQLWPMLTRAMVGGRSPAR